MPANNNGFRFKVDEALSFLSEEDRLDFDQYCWKRPTRVAVKARIDDYRREYQERGVEIPYVSQSAVDTWYAAIVDNPAAEVQRLRATTAGMMGLNGDDLLVYSASLNLSFLQAAASRISDPSFVQECKPEALIHNAIAALKETRTIGDKLASAEHKATPKALERSGAYRLAEIIKQLVKDQRFETEVRELVDAALIQHDEEILK